MYKQAKATYHLGHTALWALSLFQHWVLLLRRLWKLHTPVQSSLCVAIPWLSNLECHPDAWGSLQNGFSHLKKFQSCELQFVTPRTLNFTALLFSGIRNTFGSFSSGPRLQMVKALSGIQTPLSTELDVGWTSTTLLNLSYTRFPPNPRRKRTHAVEYTG